MQVWMMVERFMAARALLLKVLGFWRMDLMP